MALGRRLTVTEMATIHAEVKLGKEPTLKFRDAKRYRKTIEKEIARIEKDGNEAVMPQEHPEEPTRAEHARMDRDIAFMFPNGVNDENA